MKKDLILNLKERKRKKIRKSIVACQIALLGLGIFYMFYGLWLDVQAELSGLWYPTEILLNEPRWFLILGIVCIIGMVLLFSVVRYEEEGKDKSGIRPLDIVATVILVAFTIFVAMAISPYWMGRITDLIPHYEIIEISSAYASYDSTMNTTGGWVVTINFTNTGAVDATITNILINGKPWNDSSYSDATGRYVCNISPSTLTSSGLSLPAGKSATITFHIVKGLGFTSRVSVEIKLHLETKFSSPQDYPTTITLS